LTWQAELALRLRNRFFPASFAWLTLRSRLLFTASPFIHSLAGAVGVSCVVSALRLFNTLACPSFTIANCIVNGTSQHAIISPLLDVWPPRPACFIACSILVCAIQVTPFFTFHFASTNIDLSSIEGYRSSACLTSIGRSDRSLIFCCSFMDARPVHFNLIAPTITHNSFCCAVFHFPHACRLYSDISAPFYILALWSSRNDAPAAVAHTAPGSRDTDIAGVVFISINIPVYIR
jgi:hypothetical protein